MRAEAVVDETRLDPERPWLYFDVIWVDQHGQSRQSTLKVPNVLGGAGDWGQRVQGEARPFDYRTHDFVDVGGLVDVLQREENQADVDRLREEALYGRAEAGLPGGGP